MGENAGVHGGTCGHVEVGTRTLDEDGTLRPQAPTTSPQSVWGSEEEATMRTGFGR